MENHVPQQLLTLADALLLGAVGAWLYDLLRAVRLRRRRDRALTHLADGLYMALTLLALLAFALHVGDGELRLYMLMGAGLGAVGYLLLLSAPLRPLWDFWAEALEEFCRLLAWPVRQTAAGTKKFAFFVKKHFQFAGKYATIIRYQWEFTRLRSRRAQQGGRTNREKQEKSKKER